jgi:hypothetical protein
MDADGCRWMLSEMAMAGLQGCNLQGHPPSPVDASRRHSPSLCFSPLLGARVVLRNSLQPNILFTSSHIFILYPINYPVRHV